MNWNKHLLPYIQAVDELKVKLRSMRTQFNQEQQHSPIEFVTGRVKPVASILEKIEEYELRIESFEPVEEAFHDLAGIRIVCQFVDDIYTVVEMIRERHDCSICEEIDYISRTKRSGYRSYHMIILYPVQTIHGERKVKVEFQIRTLAMNFWAINEHSLRYKYKGEIPPLIKERLENAAEAAFKLDEEMSMIRNEIQEANKVYHRF